jgi:hypothetical protein
MLLPLMEPGGFVTTTADSVVQCRVWTASIEKVQFEPGKWRLEATGAGWLVTPVMNCWDAHGLDVTASSDRV